MLIYGLIIFRILFINIELKEIKPYNNYFLKIQSKEKKYDKNNISIVESIIFNNIFSSNNNTNRTNKIKDSEKVFISGDCFLSFLILLIGFLIISYGGYYYGFGLIVHSTLLLFNILVLLLPPLSNYYPLLFLFCSISGVLIFLSIRTNVVKSVKYRIQKIIYGMALGCFIHKSLFFYINNNDNEYNIIFISTFCASILVFGIIGFFLPEFYGFLFCSTISGSCYIINSLNFIVEESKTFPIYFIIQIIIISVFTFYQIYHLKYKKDEDPYYSTLEKFEENDIQRNSISNSYQNSYQTNESQKELENSKSLMNKNINNEEEEEEDEISDKEDA